MLTGSDDVLPPKDGSSSCSAASVLTVRVEVCDWSLRSSGGGGMLDDALTTSSSSFFGCPYPWRARARNSSKDISGPPFTAAVEDGGTVVVVVVVVGCWLVSGFEFSFARAAGAGAGAASLVKRS